MPRELFMPSLIDKFAGCDSACLPVAVAGPIEVAYHPVASQPSGPVAVPLDLHGDCL